VDAAITTALNQFVASSSGLTVVDVWLAQQAVILLPLVLAACWFWPGVTRVRRRRAVFAGLVSLALAFAIVVAFDVAHPIYRARPFTTLAINPLFDHQADSSFPSDHTLLGVACVGPLLLLRPRLGIWPVCAMLLVGFARVAGGVHFPSDILGSALLALVLSAAALPITTFLLDRLSLLRLVMAGSGREAG
jgi:undecaprenyl-diphosphatase